MLGRERKDSRVGGGARGGLEDVMSHGNPVQENYITWPCRRILVGGGTLFVSRRTAAPCWCVCSSHSCAAASFQIPNTVQN